MRDLGLFCDDQYKQNNVLINVVDVLSVRHTSKLS